MTIDRQARYTERVAEHHVGGLAADAGQLDERLHRVRALRRACCSAIAVAMPMSDFDLARKKPVGLMIGSSSAAVAPASARGVP